MARVIMRLMHTLWSEAWWDEACVGDMRITLLAGVLAKYES